MSELDRLYSGEVGAVVVRADGSTEASPDLTNCVVLAGSFNPLHDGHRKLLDTAAAISGRTGMFEISIENVDKPDLPRPDLEHRLEQFEGFADIVITRAPLFSDKARLLPGAWFVVGFDTAVRLLDDRYYADGDAGADMRRLAAAGVKFLVAGRVDSNGKFSGLEQIEVPSDLREMFIAIPESEFRVDVSSTALRKGQAR